MKVDNNPLPGDVPFSFNKYILFLVREFYLLVSFNQGKVWLKLTNQIYDIPAQQATREVFQSVARGK